MVDNSRVLYYFERICEIPHGSGNTEVLADYCIGVAKAIGLKAHKDSAGNCVIFKDGQCGMEQAESVIIQAHLDMVCEKDNDSEIDMEHCGVSLCKDGDKIFAEGTTLGADDGVGVATALALLENTTAPHPPLEVLLTNDEEIGMLGASAFDAACLCGKRLINLDSEDEGVFTVSCAGGNVTNCTVPITREMTDGAAYEIRISGLVGGHSGIEIDKGRANANVLLGRILCTLGKDFRIAELGGGLKDNAIPTSAYAVVFCSENPKKVVDEFAAVFKNEYCCADSKITVTAKPMETEILPMNADSTQRVISALRCFPSGIQKMSQSIDGLVQTSLNLGILKTLENSVELSFCVRSSVQSEKQELTERLVRITELLGGKAMVTGDYLPWEFVQNSRLLEIFTKAYNELFGKAPKLETIHAGVECGVIASKIPGLECISIGPDVRDVHTTSEEISVSSVLRLWQLLLLALSKMK